MCTMIDGRRRFTATVACLFLLANTCCTAMVSVPRTEYDILDSNESKIWRITTSDKKTFNVTHFTMTDSTMIITNPQAANTESSHDEATRQKTDDADVIVIDRNEITKIEREKTEYFAPTAILVAAGVFVVYFALILLPSEPIYSQVDRIHAPPN
jgi:hypothetical protein